MASKLSRFLVGLFALGATTVAATTANAAVGFCDFSDQGQILGIQTNGNAQRVGALINLTDNTNGANGSAYLTTPVSMAPGGQIKTHFQFRLYPNAGATGGTGITFTLQNKGVTALGGGGSGLGVNGVNPSVSVEFDTANDNATDGNDNHVGIFTDGKSNMHLAKATPPFVLKNGVKTDAWVDYDGTTLSVYVAQGGPKPAAPLLTLALNVYTAVNAAGAGNTVLAGFTGSNSNAASNNQDVIYWVLTDDGTEPTDCVRCQNDGDCLVVPNTPACQPNGFCGECSVTNQTRCTPASGRPVCDFANGSCVQCNDDTQCSGNTPVCSAHVCVPCANDFGGTAPACGLATKPACQGPAGAGSCTQCSATNSGQCQLPTPVCLNGVGLCGCTTDAQCGGAGSGLICEGSRCTPGCRIGGVEECAAPATCQMLMGDVGKCIQGCDPNIPGQCQNPIPICDPDSNNCVQCVLNTDCLLGQVCTPQNTCGECSPLDKTNCKPEDKGDECKPNGQCGCVVDNDCGPLDSERVCDDTAKVCRAGCRGPSFGNTCKIGRHCTSTSAAIGQCVVDTMTDGGIDGGDAGDAGDGGRDGGGLDGGPRPDASPADSGRGDGSVLDDETSIEGGGCSCNTLGSSQGVPLGGLAVSALAAVALLRRRRAKR